jgi:hypothetical protein
MTVTDPHPDIPAVGYWRVVSYAKIKKEFEKRESSKERILVAAHNQAQFEHWRCNIEVQRDQEFVRVWDEQQLAGLRGVTIIFLNGWFIDKSQWFKDKLLFMHRDRLSR